MDRHGRVFFIDHKNRTTTWLKPVLTPPAVTTTTAALATTTATIDEANSQLGANGGSELPGSTTFLLFVRNFKAYQNFIMGLFSNDILQI